MIDNPLLTVSNVSKKFCRTLKRSLAYGALDVARAIVGINVPRSELRQNEFWALSDVSFSLKQGETLGIVGLNGSGKSTLLRVISGILLPDKGEVSYRGRLGSLIALGAGFHPHMTGRENIFLNGTILGMSHAQIKKNLDSITQFSELDKFLDAPISTYSSGMVVRLGFAIAIHSDLDIMLIDEVLSVGDVSFQNKCLRKIYEKKKEGVSFIFVSHAIETVRLVCDRGIYLSQGHLKVEGPIDEVIMAYNHEVRDVKSKSWQSEGNNFLLRSDSVEFLEIGILDSKRRVVKKVPFGEDFTVFWEIKAKENLSNICAGIGIKDDRAFNIVYAFSADEKKLVIPDLKKDEKYRIEVRFLKPNIKPGVYSFNCMIGNSKTAELYLHALGSKDDGFKICSPNEIFVVDGDLYSNNAVIELETKWSVGSSAGVRELSLS